MFECDLDSLTHLIFRFDLVVVGIAGSLLQLNDALLVSGGHAFKGPHSILQVVGDLWLHAFDLA